MPVAAGARPSLLPTVKRHRLPAWLGPSSRLTMRAGAALANAVYNATGLRIRDYPLTLDKVLDGWNEREGAAQRRT